MPVSVTVKCNSTSSFVCDSTRTDATTSPFSVNLMALPIRLVSTWRSRPGSPVRASGTSGGTR